jgi:GT2 family glycosyltransferase
VSAAAGLPRVSVVVPSHDRPLRLRWLLNALEEQDLPREHFEVIIAHDSSGEATEELLRTHPLAEQAVLRHLSFEPDTAGPARKRNAAWRAAKAPVVVFTDDDCRPPPDWLHGVLEATEHNPGAVIQGATEPDPDEEPLIVASGFHRTQRIDPPAPWAQTCNIVYPRALLERLGGFDERLPIASGEDTELALRARREGAAYLGAPEARTFHAVEPMGLIARLRDAWRWRHLAYVRARSPELRRDLVLGVFQKESHALFLLALLGVVLARRRPLLAALAVPWIVRSMPSYGPGARGRARAALELGGRALVDSAELAANAVGSVRHRTLFL